MSVLEIEKESTTLIHKIHKLYIAMYHTIRGRDALQANELKKKARRKKAQGRGSKRAIITFCGNLKTNAEQHSGNINSKRQCIHSWRRLYSSHLDASFVPGDMRGDYMTLVNAIFFHPQEQIGN